MEHHENFNGVTLIGFPNHKKVFGGVYMIGDCYIGASKHVRKRLISHIQMVKRDRHPVDRVYKYFEDCIAKDVNPVIILLSLDPYDEYEMKKKLQHIVPIIKEEKFYHERYHYDAVGKHKPEFSNEEIIIGS